ncbi:MAG: hypothetical protein IJ312_00755, partial [Treponema sp.]|nr:hypothetical protein [Treponema sp.]
GGTENGDNNTGDGDNTETEIINAQEPEISDPIQSIVELATQGSADSIEKQISIGATVSDGGDISFQWETKIDANWTAITGTDEEQTRSDNITARISTLQITIEKGSTQYYRCIVTNTNKNVTGKQTASITSEEATVAYFEGNLTSIKATYNSTGYEVFENEFYDAENKKNDYSNISIEETYSLSNVDTKTYNTQYSSDNYTIEKSTEGENAIGYVPYTVTYKGETTSEDPISTTVYVPVKYKLSADSLSISGTTNETAWGTASDPEKVAQHTGSSTLVAKYSSNISLYSEEKSSEAANFNILDNCSISWSKGTKNAYNSVTVDNSIAGNFTYTATLTSNSDWIVEEEISTEYYITVCPWKIAIKDGKGEFDFTDIKDNLNGDTTYNLSVTNEAEENPSVTWTSDNDDFRISADLNQLSTPVAGENAQTATITATVGKTVVTSIKVTVAAIEYGTETNPITDWSKLANKIANTGGDIYISGEMKATEKITVAKETNIIAAKPVTITRDTLFTDTMFTVDAALTIQGTPENTITIDGNKENSASGSIFEANSNINLDYVTIKNCSSENDGGTLYVNSAIATMSNGTITNCNSKDGGAVYVNGSTFIMENGNISNCSSTSQGGAVFISDGTFEMKGTATISSCSATGDGNGIYLNNSTFKISGESKLDSESDVFLAGTSYINITENLTAENVATIKLDDSFTVGTPVLTTGEGVTLTEEIGKFTLDNKIYVIGSDGSLEEVSSGDDGTIKSVSDLSKYFDSDNKCYALTSGTYVFGSDITLDYPIYILYDYSVTLLSNKNVTITSSFEDDNLIYVDRTGDEVCGKLTLGEGEGTLTLKHVNQTYPTITSYGDLTLANNCAITESQYCAIQIKNGYFTMTGGEIFNNTYTGTNVQSSAITLDFTDISYASFEGGKIYNNETTTSGGGIMISDNSTLSTIMIKGVEIYNNSTSQNGGGIYSDTPSLYINSPSKIYTNYVNDSDCGASIYVTDPETDYDGTKIYFYLNNETISTNPYNENIGL